MTTAHFYEDDYRQIELLPVENLAWCEAEFRRIESFSATHRDGIGWTDVYRRPDAPVSLLERQITLEAFTQVVGAVLPQFSSVTTGYGDVVESARHTVAFGHDLRFVVYAEVSGEYVSAVWLDVYGLSADEAQRNIDGLCSSRRWHLLLVDWSACDVVLLAEEPLRHYLSKMSQPSLAAPSPEVRERELAPSVRPAFTFFHVLWLAASVAAAWSVYSYVRDATTAVRVAAAVTALVIGLFVSHLAIVFIVTAWIIPRLRPGSYWDHEVSCYMASVFPERKEKPPGAA